VSDISGWTFLLWFWDPSRRWRGELLELHQPAQVIKDVIRLGTTMLSGHETIWIFLRSAIMEVEDMLTTEEKMRFIDEIADYMRRLKDDEDDEARVSDKLYVGRLLTRATRKGLVPMDS